MDVELYLIDIWNLIFNMLNLRDQISIQASCLFFNQYLVITDLYNDNNGNNNNNKLLRLLSNNILKQEKFIHVTKLDASHNSKITDVSFMTKL